jgi:UDP-glucose 4-epimerase
MSKTVLITGAYGFVGRHIAKCLKQAGWRVLGIGHGEWLPNENYAWGIDRWFSSNIDLDSLHHFAVTEHIDSIIHCAGSGAVDFSFIHPLLDFERNTTTTLYVLEFARMIAPKASIVFLSTAGVYGQVSELPISENTECRPVSPYGVHKRIAEELCISYSQHFDLKISILRLFSVYGSGLKKQLLWDACCKVSNGQNMFFGTGQELRDWIHVEDVCALVKKILEVEMRQLSIYNGGTGQGVNIKAILETLFRSLNVSIKPEFSGQGKQGDPVGYVADVQAAHSLGWVPVVNVHDGIIEYSNWFRSITS